MKRFSSSSLKLLFFVGGIILLIFFLKALGLFHPVQSATLTILEPVLAPIYSAGRKISGVFARPVNVAELEVENENLREENIALKFNLTELQDSEAENVALRQLLDFFEAGIGDFPRVIARVIGRDPENQSLLLLNIGLRDGIELSNAVIVEDGVIVAKIVDVYARTSKALLVTDSQSSVAVTISGGAPSSKIAKGERGLSLILDQIPQQESITRGQLVITSGLESAIPRGLLVGEIEEIISERNDLFQRAVLRPIVDYQSTLFVAVILNPAN